MGSCSRSWFALMRRNWIYRRRYWISTVRINKFVCMLPSDLGRPSHSFGWLLFRFQTTTSLHQQILELASPVLFVYILVAIKNAAENSETFQPVTIDASFPDTGITPLTFTDYVTALRAKRMCISGETSGVIGFEISGISRQGYNWQVPLVKCNSRLCTNLTQDAAPFCEYSIVAVTGTDDGGQRRAAEFKTWVETTYPAIVTEGEMPFRFELVQLFSSPQTMDDYIKSIEYGGISFPKIAMGIVWQGDDALDYKYELRPNSTNFNAPEEFGRPVTQTTPSTLRLVDSFARNDFSVCVPVDGTPNQGPFQFSCTGQYLYNGVLTFQRLVHDFVIRQSGAADAGTVVAEAGVQFVPFPTKAYVTSGFFESIEGKQIELACVFSLIV